MPTMMPYSHYPMMPPVMDKGYGKGGPCLPPPPPQHTRLPTAHAASAWMPNLPNMQMMPTPTPPMMPMPSAPMEADQRSAQQAQRNLNKLLTAMKKEEDTLSPNLQAMAHTMQKKDERDSTGGAMSAVKSLGDAKEALLEAENARAQLVSQCKTFLQQSVVKWQEFTAQFQTSEVAHQERIQNARLNVRRAQRRFDHASKIVKVGEEAVEISDEESENEEVKDEEMPADETACKIHEGMNSIVSSLKELSESADQLEQRVKRPRKTIEEEAAMPSFGKAGVT